jgi:hypothetical protein
MALVIGNGNIALFCMGVKLGLLHYVKETD